MSFFDSLMSLFGGGKKPAANKGTGYMNNKGGAAVPPPTPKPNKNVYDVARKVPVPEWAEGLNNTQLTEVLRSHVRCKYVPAFGWKKIMTTQVGPDGNLIPEYDGVAGDCGAVKTFGMRVAQRDGRTAPYKYVDLNMAFRCCCGVPTKCPFYLTAMGEMEATTSRQR